MNKPLRVLCISRAYGEHAGGMERLSFELIRSLQEKKELVVLPLVNSVQSGSLFVSRVRSILFILLIIPRALFMARDADVVHLGDPVLSLVGFCIQKLKRIPVLVTVHGLDVSYSSLIYQAYLRLFFRNFSTYIAISDYAKSQLLARKVSGNVLVIPPGISDVLYDPNIARNALGKLLYRNIANKCILATTGRLVTRKGHAWFIRRVLPKLPRNTLYVIAGDGPERENIRKIVQDDKLDDKVVMLGRITDDAQKTLLNTIDAFVQPNISVPGDGEGFGIAPLEAALCGKKVFASAIDGIPSAIHDGKNGTLLPANESTAWITTLSNFINAPKESPDARPYTLEVFQWNKISDQYVDAIRSAT